MRSASSRWQIAALLVLASLCGCNQSPEPFPNYHEYAYVTNGAENTVTVVDLRGLMITTTIPVGKSPTGVAANPKKNEIYVANSESNNISVITWQSVSSPSKGEVLGNDW